MDGREALTVYLPHWAATKLRTEAGEERRTLGNQLLESLGWTEPEPEDPAAETIRRETR